MKNLDSMAAQGGDMCFPIYAIELVDRLLGSYVNVGYILG